MADILRHGLPPMENEASVRSNVVTFLANIHNARTKIAVVTSGGTSVKMEKAGVRAIENFSTGRRGAISAEYFMQNGFVVLYLHRTGCQLPYLRTVNDAWPNNLNFLDIFRTTKGGSELTLSNDVPPKFSQAISDYNLYKTNLFLVPFTSPIEYLNLLHVLCNLLRPYENRLILYLAAAVSDYYIDSVPEHKIQSSASDLPLNLKPFPKFLKQIVQDWAPKAYVVTFKLESDESILLRKAKDALLKYNHNLVIGNTLKTRYRSVLFVTHTSEMTIMLNLEEIINDVEIEKKIVDKVMEMHNEYLQT